MAENNKPTLKIALHDEVMFTLLKDEPQQGSNENGEWNRYDVKVNDTEMSYFASANAHKTLKDCDKGDVINIRHTPRSAGGTMYLVDVVGKANLKNKNKSSDTDLAIKWGMAFNNATRIAASAKVDHPNENVTIIKNLMPEMMKIANGLEEYLKSQEPEDDDVPF